MGICARNAETLGSPHWIPSTSPAGEEWPLRAGPPDEAAWSGRTRDPQSAQSCPTCGGRPRTRHGGKPLK